MLVEKRGRKLARKALTTPLRLKYKRKENQFWWQMFIFFSIIQLNRRNSEMCWKKCMGRSSEGDPKRTAATTVRLRWILICAGLWQRDSLQLVPNMSLCCRRMTSIKTWRRRSKWPTDACVSLGETVYLLSRKMSVMALLHSPEKLKSKVFMKNREISSNRTLFIKFLI